MKAGFCRLIHSKESLISDCSLNIHMPDVFLKIRI